MWIPIKERLPEMITQGTFSYSERVLTFDERDKIVEICIYVSCHDDGTAKARKFRWECHGRIRNVTHWMPLPVAEV